MAKQTLKIIRVDTLRCHPLALQAWEFHQTKRYQFSIGNLSAELIRQVLEVTPVHVVKSGDGGYLFFAGWEWLGLAKKVGIEKTRAIVHDNAESDSLSKIAWSYLLSIELASVDRNTNLAHIANLLEQVPKQLKKTVYQNFQTKTFQSLSRETVSALRNQRKSVVKHKKPESIIDQIISGGL